MDILLSALDVFIVASATAGAASAGVAVVGLATLDKTTATQMRERRQRYRKMLSYLRSLDREGPEDRELRSVLNAINIRRNSRRRIFAQARILIAGQTDHVSGTVLDISETGARLAFGHHVDLSGEIELDMPQAKQRVRARVVWSKGTMCGVEFLEPTRASEAPPALIIPFARRVA
jgi:PilZ domain-containing protein